MGKHVKNRYKQEYWPLDHDVRYQAAEELFCVCVCHVSTAALQSANDICLTGHIWNIMSTAGIKDPPPSLSTLLPDIHTLHKTPWKRHESYEFGRRKMRPIGCPETSIRNCHHSLCNSPKDRSFLVLSLFRHTSQVTNTDQWLTCTALPKTSAS